MTRGTATGRSALTPAEVLEFSVYIHAAARDRHAEPPRLEVITSELGRHLLAAVQANGAAPVAILQRELATHPAELDAIFAADPETPPRYRLCWADDALIDEDDLIWVVDRLITAGSLSLFVGDPGVGKTYALLSLLVCGAHGIDWCGFPVQQGATLLIDEESGQRRLKKRLREVMRGLDVGQGTQLAYVSLAGFNLRTPADVAHVDRLIGEVRPTIIVIDALPDIAPGADENLVKDMIPVMLSLRRIAEAHQAAIILIHHTGKSGAYRGSTAIKGAVDLLLAVERDEVHKDVLTFSTEKSRDAEVFRFAARLTFDKEAGAVTLRQVEPEAPQERYSRAEGYVVRYLQEHGPSLLTDIIDAPDVCEKGTAKNAVYKLVERGRVRRCDAGGQGTAARYELGKIGGSHQ